MLPLLKGLSHLIAENPLHPVLVSAPWALQGRRGQGLQCTAITLADCCGKQNKTLPTKPAFRLRPSLGGREVRAGGLPTAIQVLLNLAPAPKDREHLLGGTAELHNALIELLFFFFFGAAACAN